MSAHDENNDREINRLIRLARSGQSESYRRPSDELIESFLFGHASQDEDNEIRRAMAMSAAFRKEICDIARDLQITLSREAHDTFAQSKTPEYPDLSQHLSRRSGEIIHSAVDRRADLTVEEIALILPPHLTIGEIIGQGGFATVYRVHNTRLGVDWALKSLHLSKLSEETQIAKVLKEAQIPAKIHHPNVVTIHDVDEQNGLVLMECVDGPSLKDVMKEGVTSWLEFQKLAQGILAGLAEAHRHGIVHGDLSPRNVLLTKGNIPKLVDFGFARHVDRTKTTIGLTPGFASPEHIKARDLSPQSDVFSAGILLYRMATGRDPFPWDHASYESYCRAILDASILPPDFRFWRPPASLELVITKALSKDRVQRYPSAVEMLQAFENATSPGQQADVETSHSRKALKHYQRGLEHYRGTTKREMDWAEEEFNKALTEDPRMALAYVGLADVAIFRYMSYFDRSPVSLAKAEHYCQKALELNPSSPEAFRSLGRVYFTRREFPAAEETLQKAISLNPDYLAAHISLAWCFIEAHKLDDAGRFAKSALALSEDEFEVLMTFTRVYYDKKEYERSLVSAQEAVSIHRRSGRAYYDLAMSQRAVGQFAEARKSFQLSLEYHGDPTSRVDLGFTELLEGNAEEAKAHFSEATDDTFGFLAMYYLGLAENLMGNRTAAETCFQQALDAAEKLSRKDPSDPFPRAVGAMAAAALGDEAKSAMLASIARELEPQDGFIAYYCACAASWSNKEKGAQLLKAALNLPHSPSQLEGRFDPHFQ